MDLRKMCAINNNEHKVFGKICLIKIKTFVLSKRYFKQGTLPNKLDQRMPNDYNFNNNPSFLLVCIQFDSCQTLSRVRLLAGRLGDRNC